MDDNLSNLSHQIVIILLTVHTEENHFMFVLSDFDCVLNLVNSRTVLSPKIEAIVVIICLKDQIMKKFQI